MVVNEKFQEFAKSYSGYEGGNCIGKYWFCGIEYGFARQNNEKDCKDYNKRYFNYLDEELNKNYNNDIVCGKSNERMDKKYQFNLKLAKLFHRIENDLDFDDFVRKDNLFELFNQKKWLKLNLYPIAMNNVSDSSWTRLHYEQTGFFTKQQYRVWCQDNRFPNFLKMVKNGECKNIICCGKDFRNDFLLAFCPKEKLGDALFLNGELKELDNKKNIVEIFKINSNNIKNIIITPFFGQGGIMSDKDIDKLANLIKTL